MPDPYSKAAPDHAGNFLLKVAIGLVRVDKESARAWVSGEADGVLFVWDANAAEQLQAGFSEIVRGYDPVMQDAHRRLRIQLAAVTAERDALREALEQVRRLDTYSRACSLESQIGNDPEAIGEALGRIEAAKIATAALARGEGER